MGALGTGEKPTKEQLTYLRQAAPKGARCDVMAKRLGISAQRVAFWCDAAKIPRRHYVRGYGTRIGVVDKVQSYAPKSKTAQRRTRVYPWLLHSATTPAGLQKHRATLEEDCFPSELHRRVLQEAAAEYDRWNAAEKPGGRPRKPQPLFIPTKHQRVA